MIQAMLIYAIVLTLCLLSAYLGYEMGKDEAEKSSARNKSLE